MIRPVGTGVGARGDLAHERPRSVGLNRSLVASAITAQR